MLRSSHSLMPQGLSISLGLYVLAYVVLSGNLPAQESKGPSAAELRSEVPELSKFHEVVYKIWHSAWPEKDAEMLKDLAPEVQKLGGDVCRAKLPGILREKDAAWKENGETLKSIIEDYMKAAKEDDKQKLLDAAERLHGQYEKIVRLVRPVLKELDEFHAVLYPLYHYFKPQKNRKKTIVSVERLKDKMEQLNKANLPVRLKEKETAFAEARIRLAESLKSLDSSLTADDWTVIDHNIEELHARYEDLNRIFD